MPFSAQKRCSRPLTLNEIINELEKDEEESAPVSISILPPENCNADVTDEDSGDENYVTLHNLPGSQLRAPAELCCRSADDSGEDDDDVPLIQLSKRRRVTAEESPSTSKSNETTSGVIISKNKSYKWTSRDIHPTFDPWLDMQTSATHFTPLQYFEMLFGDDIINMLVHYTNLYAAQKNASKPINVSTDEMRCFIGILLYSGYVVLPRRCMYWQNAADCGMPIVYNAMARDRFTNIMSNLHCCDNINLKSDDKFAKLRILFDKLNESFYANAPFEEHHSIDEAMIPYYGGHPCKQFIRGKPIRWGYKFWVGATRLGYVVWFDPYQGQSNASNQYKHALGLGASVVLQYADVLRKINGQAPFHLFFDNFFTSIHLIDELRERGIKATGTVRENRVAKCPLPTNKDLQRTPRGTFKYQSTRAEQILVCKWHDNSVVTVSSNAGPVQPIVKAKRFSQQLKKYVLVDQPAVIKKYNEHMGGVDRSDQNIGLYRTSIRGKKWYFSLICHGLDMAVHNSWQLYKNNGGEYDFLHFRRSVATSLLETYKRNADRKTNRVSQNFREHSRFDGKDHLIRYRDNQLRCIECHKKGNFYCPKCNVTLHPKICFEAFHLPK